MAQVKKKKNLTEGAILPKILLFALPLIATSILQLLFNTADTIVVGRWGGSTPEECETALAAVGSCSSLITLFVNLFLGLSVGAGVVVAQDIGAGREDEVRRAVHTAVIAALGAGMIVTVLGFFSTAWLLELMGTDESVLPEATKYIYAYFCGMPANMLYNYCASILRSKGDTMRPLLFLSVAGVVNVVLNLVSVLIFHMGAMGVGIATAASQWVSCILIVIYMMRMEGPCRIELSRLRVDLVKLRHIFSIGLPAGLQSMLFSISNVLIQSSVNSLGPTVVAANTTSANLDAYIYVTQNALHHTAMTFVSQNAGAVQYKRMKRSILYCLLVVIAVGLLVGTVMYLLGDSLMRLYTPDNPTVIEFAKVRFWIFCFTYFLCGIMEIGSGVLRALGRSFISMVISLVGSCALRIVWLETVFKWVRSSVLLSSDGILPEGVIELTDGYMTKDGIVTSLFTLFVSYPITWVITSAALFIMCFVCMRRFKREHIEQIK